MSTDFSYGGKQNLASGPFKPSGKDMPLDARTRINNYSEKETIPNPYVGMIVTVLTDENNNNKMTDYKVKSLKANSAGIANMVIDEMIPYVDYLGVSGGSSSGGSGTVDLSNYATKAYADNAVSTALDGHTFKFLTQAEYDALEVKDPLVEYHITDAADDTVDTSNLASDLSLTGSNLQLKNSSGSLIGTAITLPTNSTNVPTKTSELTNDSGFATTSYVDEQIAKIEISGGSSELANLLIVI